MTLTDIKTAAKTAALGVLCAGINYDPSDQDELFGELARDTVDAVLGALIEQTGGPDHVVRVTAEGWTISHPLTERLDGTLFDCDVHKWLRLHRREPGEYTARRDAEGYVTIELREPAPTADPEWQCDKVTGDVLVRRGDESVWAGRVAYLDWVGKWAAYTTKVAVREGYTRTFYKRDDAVNYLVGRQGKAA